MYVCMYVCMYVLLLFKYSCLHFQPTHPRLPPSNLSPLVLSVCPLYRSLDGPSSIIPHYPSPSPLWLLSVCSLFQCLWLYLKTNQRCVIPRRWFRVGVFTAFCLLFFLHIIHIFWLFIFITFLKSYRTM